jgi:MFS family permease
MLGAGAIVGGFALTYLRVRVARNWIVSASVALFGCSMLALAHGGRIWIGFVSMFFSGMAWIGVISSLMAYAQVSLPAWVRARGLAFFWVTYMGGMALGSAVWGQVASWVGISWVLTFAATGALLSIIVTWPFRIASHEVLDLTPSLHWTTPHFREEKDLDRGPVMIQIEYHIDMKQLPSFSRAMHDIRRLRHRDGAYMWEMFLDYEEEGKVVECFMFESWLEHLRQHERETAADKHIYKKVRAFHIGSRPPRVRHYIGGHLNEPPMSWVEKHVGDW